MTEHTAPPRGHVIVAVDGSPSADNAVDWAADEATLRGTRLEILHAWEWKSHEASDWYGHHLYNQADEVTRAAAERARLRRPALDVTTTIEHGQADEVITTAVERADLTVMGSRGRGGFTGLLLGSVSRAVAAAGNGPLLVVRSGPDGVAPALLSLDEPATRTDARPVLVGISGEWCRPAVEAACAEAARLGCGVRVLHAWSFPDFPVYGLPATVGPTPDAIRLCQENGEGIVSGTVARARDEHKEAYADLDILEDVVNGPRARVMVDASKAAALVVIATRRRPGRVGRHLGPVTHALLHHAHAPVLLVPVD